MQFGTKYIAHEWYYYCDNLFVARYVCRTVLPLYQVTTNFCFAYVPVHIWVKHLFQAFSVLLGHLMQVKAVLLLSNFLLSVYLSPLCYNYNMAQTCNKLNILVYSARIAQDCDDFVAPLPGHE